MAVNKVVLGDQTLIDLTADSVTPDKLFKGITAHNMKGESIVGTMEGGSTPSEPTDNTAVIFADYDGNLIDTWTKDEVASKTTLPTPPAHTGLVFEGWNWTLEDIQTDTTGQVITVGPLYHTESGLTEIDIEVSIGSGKEIKLFSTPLTTDWGDGTTTTDQTNHTYENYGNYTVKIEAKVYGNKKEIYFGASKEFMCPVKAVRVAQGVTGLYNFANWAQFLEYSAFPNTLENYADVKPNLGKILLLQYPANIKGYTFKYISLPKNYTTPISGSGGNNLEYIYLSPQMSTIENSGFAEWRRIKSITISESVDSIGSNAFQNCSSLQNITIPDGVTSIGGSTFQNCYSLQNITIPESVASIGSSAFRNCYSLQSITIPSSVTSIGQNAFYNCSSLQSINIPDGVTSIGSSAFRSCYSLQNITIPESVASIGEQAFVYCSSLQSITIPSSVTSIGQQTFAFCSLIRYAKINTSAEIKSYAFNFGRTNIPLRTCIYDFSGVTVVPVLSSSSGIQGKDYVSAIIVPDALYDEWIAATNWVAYASKIKKASEVENTEVA